MNSSEYNHATEPPDEDVEPVAEFSGHLRVSDIIPNPKLLDLTTPKIIRLAPATRVVIGCGWTDPATIKRALDHFLDVRQQRPGGERFTPSMLK